MGDLIISVKEARKLLGKTESDKLTDDEVEELINQLDFISHLAIKDYLKKRAAGELPDQLK